MKGIQLGDGSGNGDRSEDRSKSPSHIPLPRRTVDGNGQTNGIDAELDPRGEDAGPLLDQVAHDLKEPLHVIEGHLQIARRRIPDGESHDLRQALAFALDNTHRAQEMVTSLLDQARVQANGTPAEPVDTQALIEKLLSDHEARIAETGARITYDALPTVLVYRDHMTKLFENLIINAVKYRGDAPPRIHITHERMSNGDHRFSVTDDGIGIPTGEAESIFEMFSRAHPGADTEGTGMGLAICKRIVEHHGGRIWMDSTPGNGATFHFTLRSQPTPEEAGPTPDRASGGGPSSSDGPSSSIVDRNNEPIGTTSGSNLQRGDGPLEVELLDTLCGALGLDDGHVEVPREWVAGIRRDEIRLSVSIQDPHLGLALRAKP